MPHDLTPKPFDVDRLSMDLRRIVGVRSAKRLLPRFAQAAAVYKESERETSIQAERRRRVAKAHVALLAATEKDISQLLRRLDAMSALIPEASTRGYLPGTALSGSLGELAARAAVRKTLDAAGEAVRMVTEAREWRETVRAWRDTARLDMRGQAGRRVGDRRLLAEWVALQLARERLPLKKSVGGMLARVLSIMYDAAGIKVPKNMRRDVCRAIDDTERDRQKVH